MTGKLRTRIWWRISIQVSVLIGCIFLLFRFGFTDVGLAQGLFDGPVDRLPVLERVGLRAGKIIVTGEGGNYVARVLVTARPETAWQVLTDYNNFPQFLPNIVSSKVLEEKGNRKVVEQVRQQQVFLFAVQARILYTAMETEPDRIDFKLVEGDLAKMDGFWLVEPVAPYPGANPDQVLITHQVNAVPNSGTADGLFNDIYRGALEETLEGFRREVLKRSTL